MSNWRVSRQDAYDLVGKDEADKIKSEKDLKWSEIADELIKMKTREMVSNYVGNIFGNKFKAKAQLLGGIILIFLGVKIVLEHLYGITLGF